MGLEHQSKLFISTIARKALRMAIALEEESSFALAAFFLPNPLHRVVTRLKRSLGKV